MTIICDVRRYAAKVESLCDEMDLSVDLGVATMDRKRFAAKNAEVYLHYGTAEYYIHKGQREGT